MMVVKALTSVIVHMLFFLSSFSCLATSLLIFGANKLTHQNDQNFEANSAPYIPLHSKGNSIYGKQLQRDRDDRSCLLMSSCARERSIPEM